MESRIFISAGTSHKILRKPNYAKCFNNEKRYEGEIQKLNNILRLHGHKVLRNKGERENVFQALSIISSKINKGAEWSPLYTAKAIDAAYLHRTLFSEAQQQCLVRWKEKVDQMVDLPALQAAAVPAAVAASPYDKFALEALPQSAYAAYFTFNNKVCPRCGYRRPLYCWDCFEPVVVLKVGDSNKQKQSKKNKKNGGKNKNNNSKKKKKPRRIRPAERLVVLKEALDAKQSHQEKKNEEEEDKKSEDEVEVVDVEDEKSEDEVDEVEAADAKSEDDEDEEHDLGEDERQQESELAAAAIEKNEREADELEVKSESGELSANDSEERREARKRELQAQAKRAEILVKWGREDFEPHSLVLPLKVDIIIHPKLKLRRCTSIVAAVLSSPRYVEVHRALASHSKPFRVSYSPAAYAASVTDPLTSQPRPSFSSRMPDLDPDSTVVLYPSPDALSIEEAHLAFKEKGKRIERAVVIEATWEGSTQILNDPKLANLTKVKIEAQKTFFWRFQSNGEGFLSSIEAMYYLCREYAAVLRKHQPEGQAAAGEDNEAALDRLLYYFCLGHQRTASFYKERPDLLPPVSWTFHNNAVPKKE